MYGRKVYDDKYHIKNFLLSYKGLVNLSKIKSSPKDYMNQLNEIQSSTSGVDFSKTTLFICEKDISRELFLVGFSRLKNLKSYYYCSLMDLADIWWGNRKASNNNISDEDILFSDQDISQDIFSLD